jgi:hypothetical protein
MLSGPNQRQNSSHELIYTMNAKDNALYVCMGRFTSDLSAEALNISKWHLRSEISPQMEQSICNGNPEWCHAVARRAKATLHKDIMLQCREMRSENSRYTKG